MSRSSRQDAFILLSDAYWKFASASLRGEYWELEELPPPKMPDPNDANWAEGVKAISESFSHAFRTSQTIGKMQAFVGEKLRRGDLEARGFKIKPTKGEGQETIQPYFFDHAVINWNKNIVENFGECFAAVEVRKPQKTKDSVCKQVPHEQHPQEPKDNEPPKKKGPRSNRPEIMEAIAILDQQGFDLKGPNKPYYEAILRQLRRSSGDAGYSESVLFNCLKEYLSQNSYRRILK